SLPACSPLPCATIVPVKFPLRSVVMSMNGRVFTPMPVLLPGTVPAGGLKLIVGNDCVKAGGAVGGVSNDPEPSEAKNRANTVLVEMFWTGVILLTVAELETVVPEVACTMSLPLCVPA